MNYKTITDEELEARLNKSMSNLDLSSFNLAGKKFKDVVLCRANFDNCNLEGSIFENVNLSFSSFNRASLKKTQFINCNLFRTDLSYSDLTESKSNSRMFEVNLKRANLMNCDFNGSDMEDANFSFAQNTKKKPQIGKIYKLHKPFSYRDSAYSHNIINDDYGMIIAVHKNNTFDILCSDKVIRNMPTWANYSLLVNKETE